MKVVSEKEIKAAHRSGTQKAGDKFTITDREPFKPSPPAPPKKTEPTPQERFFTSMIAALEILQKELKGTSDANTSALAELVKQIKENGAPVVSIESPPPATVKVNVDHPKEWRFTIERDSRGLIQEITAKRIA